QQLGFDFTGRGRIAGITFHGTFFIVANVKFVANGGHAFYAFRPAIGVGAGNTPVVIDETADIKRAVASVLMSKTFDNGVICASE
ncbi:hypothetical protein MJN76_28615, partial [Salmonella enterica subsp. enterica serovar Anatum]|nr:hypothetical protein [Salmonella enterica subsp. enterica serovar Anatum]